MVAQNLVEAAENVIRHSRHIHLLLVNDSDGDGLKVATLKPYRPYMQVIHISPHSEIGAILMEVSTVLAPPSADEIFLRAKVRAVAGEVDNAKQEKKRDE